MMEVLLVIVTVVRPNRALGASSRQWRYWVDGAGTGRVNQRLEERSGVVDTSAAAAASTAATGGGGFRRKGAHGSLERQSIMQREMRRDLRWQRTPRIAIVAAALGAILARIKAIAAATATATVLVGSNSCGRDAGRCWRGEWSPTERRRGCKYIGHHVVVEVAGALCQRPAREPSDDTIVIAIRVGAWLDLSHLARLATENRLAGVARPQPSPLLAWAETNTAGTLASAATADSAAASRPSSRPWSARGGRHYY